MELESICVFCGANPGARPQYLAAAQAFGRRVAEEGLTLVYGGGNIGLMGAVADAALEAGGRVLGIIPGFLKDKEVAHDGLSELVVTESMHQRKAQMAAHSDAFVALPGGFGTFEELFEMITWSQLHLHQKPVALLNLNGFYDPLMAQIDRAISEGFIREENRPLVTAHPDIDDLVAALKTYRHHAADRWLPAVAG
ncbi:TIGR00730 family Rossman fold protein [Crenobacter cavernae]|uniref:Cytokinin riboside 5'-monophosphate phosphoribohydrolase n=1 Tax=Crenobacter cavernae TaxID=2290923 RepID=A0ABY0FD61_9NEIS|nr:TIGR00730 family Rossman fold protein [Crenobacter cavernae]RXZ42734.1 TIGR00730 family Rossman fold protein [Crenobacter cavernae]